MTSPSEKDTVVIGALNNLNALCDWLLEKDQNVLVLASGWKDKFNLEDTICAGAIADQLIESGRFKADEDSTIAAKFIYRSARDNMFAFLRVLAPPTAAKTQLERRREVLFDAQQPDDHSHPARWIFGAIGRKRCLLFTARSDDFSERFVKSIDTVFCVSAC